MNKILDKIIRSEYAPSNKNVVWDDGKEFKTYEKGKWKSKGGGNGVSIVDSVDKLDANAPVGTLAAVAVQGTVSEKPFAEFARASLENIDRSSYTFLTDGLDILKGISIKVPTGLIECTDSPVLMACTKNLSISSSTDGFIVEFGIVIKTHSETQKSYISQYGGAYMDVAAMQQVPFILMDIAEDGTATIHEDAILEFNNILSNNEIYFLGPFENIMNGEEITDEYFYFFDMLSSGLQGTSSTASLFIKKNNWEELYSKDLESIIKDVDTLKTSKVNTIPINTYSSYRGISPNIYYTYICNSTGTISLKFNAIEDTTIYNEYIIEIKCTSTPTSISFVNSSDSSEMSIIWANGAAPVFEAGMTYIISIANGYGVYSMFPNS